nr:hypothetical protein MFLOJ_38590 [Mycobacterium florentinum]
MSKKVTLISCDTPSGSHATPPTVQSRAEPAVKARVRFRSTASFARYKYTSHLDMGGDNGMRAVRPDRAEREASFTLGVERAASVTLDDR